MTVQGPAPGDAPAASPAWVLRRSVAAGGASLSSRPLPPPLRAAASAVQREDIVGTDHDEYKPTQDAVHPDIVELYEEALRSDRFKRSAAFKKPEEDSDDKLLDDGHHSYVASKRADVEIEIEDMGLNEFLQYENDWSGVTYRRFLNFETFLEDENFIHHDRLAALIEAIENSDAEGAVADLKSWEVNILQSQDGRYSDVWEAAAEAGYSSELEEMLGERAGLVAEDSSGNGSEEEQGDQDDIIPEDSSGVDESNDDHNVVEQPPVHIPSAYFWHQNYGLGSMVHGYMENAEVQVLTRTPFGFTEVRLISANLPPQFQSFTQMQPPLPAVGHVVWMNSSDLP